MAALFSLGIQNPREHIFLASAENLATLVIARAPLSSEDRRTLSDTAARLQFRVLARPGESATESVFDDLLSATSPDSLARTAGSQWLDMSAPTDARPFFFNQLRLANRETFKLFVALFTTGSIGQLPLVGGEGFTIWGNVVAMGTLLMLIVLSLGAVLLVIVVPARAAIKDVDRGLVYLGSLYFLLIGIGFMFIEIGLIQRMSVVLGHPIYALGVVLFSIILSAGMGSLLSERFMPSSRLSILVWLSLLVAYLLGLPYWLPEFIYTRGSRLP